MLIFVENEKKITKKVVQKSDINFDTAEKLALFIHFKNNVETSTFNFSKNNRMFSKAEKIARKAVH